MAESLSRTLAPPQVFSDVSTARQNWTIALTLVPAALWGMSLYSLKAGIILALAIGSSILGDFLLRKIHKQGTLKDGSAVLWGLLLGMSLPPGAPGFIPVVGGLFMILVVKGISGNLGSYWVHPVLLTRTFLALSWPGFMSAWRLPFSPTDAVAGSTPLMAVKDSLLAGTGSSTPLTAITSHGIPRTDSALTDWLNTHILTPMNITLPGGYSDMFLGNFPGAIGEGSAFLLLAASVFLLGRRLIRWEIPLFFFLSFSTLTWVFGGLPFGLPWFSGDVLFQILSGSFLLILFFVATDPVTTPMTRQGRIFFALGAGVLTFFLRFFSSAGDGTGTAVLLMTLMVPLLDQGFRKRKIV